MPDTFSVALVQDTFPPFEREDNLTRAESAVAEAAERRADIVCLPEMFLTGYPMYCGGDGKLRRSGEIEIDGFAPLDESNDPDWMPFAARMRETAEPADGPYAARLADLAAKHGVALVAGVCESLGNDIYNSAFIFDASGIHIGTYRKVHVCPWWPAENLLKAGSSFDTWIVDTRAGRVELGVIICCDREYPESARALMLSGAEIVLVPNAGGFNEKRTVQVTVRAFENCLAMGVANHAADYGGRSMAANYDGEMIAQAGDAAEVLVAEIDLPALRDARAKCLWAERFRAPQAYGSLVDPR